MTTTTKADDGDGDAVAVARLRLRPYEHQVAGHGVPTPQASASPASALASATTSPHRGFWAYGDALVLKLLASHKIHARIEQRFYAHVQQCRCTRTRTQPVAIDACDDNAITTSLARLARAEHDLLVRDDDAASSNVRRSPPSDDANNDDDDDARALARLATFLPQSFGTVRLQLPLATTATTTSAPCDYLILENLSRGLRSPCVIDLKMGTRTYDRHASAAKVREETSKYAWQEEIGFRISGMRVCAALPPPCTATCVWGKADGRHVTPDALESAFRTFFRLDPAHARSARHVAHMRERVLPALVRRLRALLAVMRTVRSLEFYASSLLLLYDACDACDDEIESAASCGNADDDSCARLFMVDFGHTCGSATRSWWSSSGSNSSGSDIANEQPEASATAQALVNHGYVHGLNRLLAVLERLQGGE